MTKVKFYIEGPTYPGCKDVLAVFPEIDEGMDRMSCYAHVGQHSCCTKEYLKSLRIAHPIEYSDLLEELKSIGYDDLEIIDSRKTLSKILYQVNCKYGAPMGRANVGTKPTDKKIFTSWVALYDGAYDKGGAYWGSPANLYVEYTKDLTYINFYRK